MTDLERFEADYRSLLNSTMERDDLTGVPVLATEYRTSDNGTEELWVVYWECDKADSEREQKVTVANYFAKTSGHHNGEQPDGLRVYGVTNLQNGYDTTMSISTVTVERLFNQSLSKRDYAKHWLDSIDPPTGNESQIAYEMAVEDSGNETAYEAFKEHHREIGGCPGGATDPSGGEW